MNNGLELNTTGGLIIATKHTSKVNQAITELYRERERRIWLKFFDMLR